MKVRKKKVRLGRDGRIMNSRSLANLQPPWKPGHAAVSPGRPRGSGSVITYLKRLLRDKPMSQNFNYETLADEIAHILIKQARKGKFQFMQLLLDRAESRQITEEELKTEVERIYTIVRKHVKDPAVMTAIAQELGQVEDEDV